MTGGSIFSILSKGNESLMNSRVGIDVTGHNISNAHVPGYSRQRVNLESKEPTSYGNLIFGNGANIESISRIHDKYIENQLRKESQTVGEKEAINKGLERIELLFNPEMTSTIRDRYDAFFNSLRELSNFPDESSVKAHVIETSNNLCSSIKATHAGIDTIQNDITEELRIESNVLNEQIKEIAKLNQNIQELSAGNKQNANDLLDKRDLIIKDIATKIDLNVYTNEQGSLTLRGPAGVLLVDGNRAASLSINNKANQQPALIYNDFEHNTEIDITDLTATGKFGGLIKVRNDYAQTIRNELNTAAKTFANSFNNVYAMGYGAGEYDKMNGRHFFEDYTDNEAAANIQVSLLAQNDLSSLAIGMTPESPGDNIIVNELIKLSNKGIFEDGKSTFYNNYDRFIGRIGVDGMKIKQEFEASKIVINQMQTQRESIVGVSLDEEASNLLKYQHLFTASSKLITTADEMLKTILDLKR